MQICRDAAAYLLERLEPLFAAMLPGFFCLPLRPPALLAITQHRGYRKCNQDRGHQDKPPTLPDWRQHAETHRRRRVAQSAVRAHCPHQKPVASRRKIWIVNATLIGWGAPIG